MSRRRILAVAVGAWMLVAVLVLVALAPRNDARDAVFDFDQAGAVSVVVVTLDSFDAARGVLRVRVSITDTEAPLPAEGATFLTDLPGIGSIDLPVERLTADRAGDALVDSGELGEYPFDQYRDTFRLAVIPGRNARPRDEQRPETLPVRVVVVDALPEFIATVRNEADNGVSAISVDMTRRTGSVVWAAAMMACYWVLAISAFAVVLATVLRLREFETRHLAWLAAMIFAFAAFRNTAPGNPPIGVFLDFAAFFWAVFLVAVSLVVLVVFYLTGDRGAPDPPARAEAVADQA